MTMTAEPTQTPIQAAQERLEVATTDRFSAEMCALLADRQN